MVCDPVAADHGEADEEADHVRLQVAEGVGELADAVAVGDGGDDDRDHEQRHRDREQAVAEGEHAAELDAVVREAAVAALRGHAAWARARSPASRRV
jgi:hypothetical protein